MRACLPACLPAWRLPLPASAASQIKTTRESSLLNLLGKKKGNDQISRFNLSTSGGELRRRWRRRVGNRDGGRAGRAAASQLASDSDRPTDGDPRSSPVLGAAGIVAAEQPESFVTTATALAAFVTTTHVFIEAAAAAADGDRNDDRVRSEFHRSTRSSRGRWGRRMRTAECH